MRCGVYIPSLPTMMNKVLQVASTDKLPTFLPSLPTHHVLYTLSSYEPALPRHSHRNRRRSIRHHGLQRWSAPKAVELPRSTSSIFDPRAIEFLSVISSATASILPTFLTVRTTLQIASRTRTTCLTTSPPYKADSRSHTGFCNFSESNPAQQVPDRPRYVTIGPNCFETFHIWPDAKFP